MSIYLPIAEMAMSLPLLAALGLAVGVLSGMVGIGGGFILTPMLIFLGVPAGIAVGTGASLVTATSLSGALGQWQRGNVDVEMGLFLVAGGLIGAVMGVWLQVLLKTLGQLELFTGLAYVVVLGSIGSLMLIESIHALRRKQVQVKRPSSGRRHHNFIQGLPFKRRFRTSKIYMSALPPVGAGTVVGWLTAIMGVGGGFLLVPALIFLLRVPTRIALGTSSFQIIFVTIFTTLLQSVTNHSVDMVLATPLRLGGVVGAQIGVRIGQRLMVEQLRALLAMFVLAVAIRMAMALILQPDDLYSLESIVAPGP